MLLDIGPTMPRSRLITLVGVALLATGCATTGPSSDSQGPRGVSGPVAWEIIDIGRLVSSDGERMRWSYTILLKETAGAAIQFEHVERGSYTSGMEIIGGTPQSRPFGRTLAANSEIRYPAWESWGWAASQGARHAFGGAATIQPLTVEYRFVGRDSGGRTLNVPVRIRLDRSVGKPVTPPPTSGPLPPAKVMGAGELEAVAGIWQGSYRSDDGDFDIPIEFVIRPNGSLDVAENNPVTNRFRGTVWARDGKLIYSHGRDSGMFTLHEGNGKRVLVGHVSGPRATQAGAPPSTFGYTVRIEWQSPSAQAALGPVTGPPAMVSERWTGVSTGEGSGCHPLKLALTIIDGEISGSATMQTSSITLYWEATGKVLPGNAVVVTTTTGDRSMPGNVIRWEGTLTDATLTLRQPSSLRCREPRSAVLTRSR